MTHTTRTGGTRFETGKVLTLTVAHLLHDIYSSFLAPVLPLLIGKLGISYTLAGFLAVVQRLPSALNPFVGVLADRFPMRWFVVAAPAVTAVSMSLMGIAPNYAVLVVLLTVMGLSSTCFHVPSPVMVKQISGDRTGKGMSWFMFGGEIARTLAPLVILGGVTLWGFEGTWRLSFFGIAASIVLYFKVHTVEIPARDIPGEERTGVVACLRRHMRFFILITGITFFRAALHGSLMSFLPTFITVRGQSVWMGGAALSAIQLSGAAGTFFWGAVSDRIGRKRTLLVTSIIYPLLMWGFMFTRGYVSFGFLILLGFTLFATTPVLLAMVQERDTQHPAFINGIYISISFLITSSAVMVTGILAEQMGLESAFRLAAVVSAGTIPFILMLDR